MKARYKAEAGLKKKYERLIFMESLKIKTLTDHGIDVMSLSDDYNYTMVTDVDWEGNEVSDIVVDLYVSDKDFEKMLSHDVALAYSIKRKNNGRFNFTTYKERSVLCNLVVKVLFDLLYDSNYGKDVLVNVHSETRNRGFYQPLSYLTTYNGTDSIENIKEYMHSVAIYADVIFEEIDLL